MSLDLLEQGSLQKANNIGSSIDVLRISQSIKSNVDDLIESDNKAVLSFLERHFSLLSREELNDLVGVLFNNLSFLSFLNDYISTSFDSLFEDNQSYDFEKMSFSMFLLSGLKFSNPLIDINNYDYSMYGLTLDYSLQNISNSKSKEEFDIYFWRFYNICQLANNLSIFNQIDSSRHNLIKGLLSIVSPRMDSFLRMENPFIKQEHKNYISCLGGKFLLNFTNIDIDNKNFDVENSFNNLLDKVLLLEKGYNKCRESNFGNNYSSRISIRQVYIGNMTSIIFDTLNNALNNGYSFENILSIDSFKHIVLRYYLIILGKKINISDISLEGFRNLLNNSLSSLYFDNNDELGKVDYNNNSKILEDFISNKCHNGNQIETILNIIKFNIDSIDLSCLLKVGEYLVGGGLYNNYHFEYFKLEIFNFILNQLSKEPSNKEINLFLEKLTDYIDINKTASQLLKSYSNIYKNIAYFYVRDKSQESHRKAMKFFYFYLRINGMSVFDLDKDGLEKDFFNEIGSFFGENNILSLNGDNYVEVGELVQDNYGQLKDKSIRNNIDSMLSNYLNNVLLTNSIDPFDYSNHNNHKLEEVLTYISSKLFYGVAKLSIVDNHGDPFDVHNGMIKKIDNLFNGYNLVFVYPKVQENLFNSLYDREKDYIALNLKNLISVYLKTKENHEKTKKAFTDDLTGLPNQAKLKSDLSKLDKVSFINVKLNTVAKINNGYAYEKGDEYISLVADALMNIPAIRGKVYRLSGVQFGITVMNEDNIDEIIKSINEIEIFFNGSITKIVCLIGCALSTNQKHIEKTNMAISGRFNGNNNVFVYDENIHNSDEYKKKYEYLLELKKALSSGNVTVYYQDIVDANGVVYKRESLMRVIGENGFPISPQNYLDSAEEFNHLTYITLNNMEIIFNNLADNPDLNPSINLSGDDLDSKEVIDKLKESIYVYGIDPSSVTLEILEGGWAGGSNKINVIKSFKDIGYKIAVDDFGAGESGINRLNKLLTLGIIDYIKIDGAIVKNLLSEDEITITSAEFDISYIVDKASLFRDAKGNRKVKVIAEYVENEILAKKLISLGVDFLQGYHYSKPYSLNK